MVEAQAKPDVYAARNTFGVMAEYSNDSSHVILGSSDNIKLGAVGLQYQRRLLMNRYLVFSYAAEFRPVILQSNPTENDVIVQTLPTSTTYVSPPQLTQKCTVRAYSFRTSSPVYAATETTHCSRELNYAQGVSPAGFGLNFRPQHRLQPTFSTLEGYIFSTKELPVSGAGSFNFTFELGVGLEYFVAPKRSVRLEYQVQHYSNGFTAAINPGVDNGMFKLTYSFGR